MASASSSPTPERLTRGPVAPPRIDEQAFRPYWRACDRLENLRTTGLTTADELRAALAFRRLYDHAFAGSGNLRAVSWVAVRADKHCHKPLPAMTEIQAASLARLRRIKDALGALYDLIEMAVIMERPWCAIGRRLEVEPRTARTWCIAAISALAAV